MTGWIGRLALVALLALGLVAAGCGDDDEEEPAQPEATADVDRYCELARQLDKAGDKVFARLEEQEASRNEFKEAEAELFRTNEAEIEELQQVAPPEIQADVETLVARFQARAGLGDDAPTVKQREVAEERVTQFEEENCGEALIGEGE
jgi:hypothetical protein